jgi:hypothetical protein
LTTGVVSGWPRPRVSAARGRDDLAVAFRGDAVPKQTAPRPARRSLLLIDGKIA